MAFEHAKKISTWQVWPGLWSLKCDSQRPPQQSPLVSRARSPWCTPDIQGSSPDNLPLGFQLWLREQQKSMFWGTVAGEINICSMSRSFLLTRALPSETSRYSKAPRKRFSTGGYFSWDSRYFSYSFRYLSDLAKTQAHIRIPHERASFIPSKVINPTGANEGRNDWFGWVGIASEGMVN